MMAPRCPSCVSWILVASYAVLLGVGGLGVWISVNNFWDEEPLPPTPPQHLEVTITTTTTTASYYDRYRTDEVRIPDKYQEYVYAMNRFAKATHDSRLYALVPCVVCVVVAAMVLVAGLCSRQLFCSTFSLYNSVGLWSLTLGFIITYQNVVAWNSQMSLDAVCWVVGIHAVLMVLLSTQILLCVWELRRQKAGWPTINGRSVFTLEGWLVVARMAVTVCALIYLSDSQLIRGFQAMKNSDNEKFYDRFYEKPYTRYPLVLTLVCYSGACYTAVATLETILSVFLGKVHIYMTAISSVVSALCCVTVAILTSPVIERLVVSTTYIYPDTMFFFIGLSVVTFIHVVTCVGFPTTSRSPPQIINKIIDNGVSTMYSLVGNLRRDQLWCPALPGQKINDHFIINFISSIFSIISIIVITASWASPLYRAWGSVLVLCVNSATLVRTLPPAVIQLKFNQAEVTPLNQKLLSMVCESVALLVGSITMLANLYYGGEIFGGVINLLFFVFQILVIIKLVKSKSGTLESKEDECLTENVEVASQDESNELTDDNLLA